VSAPARHRGEVWLASLDKVRPVVVLTRDPPGRYLHSVIVGPVTRTVRGLTTEVEVGPGRNVAGSRARDRGERGSGHAGACR